MLDIKASTFKSNDELKKKMQCSIGTDVLAIILV